MKFATTWTLLLVACCLPGVACAQLEIVSNAAPQSIFFGAGRVISVTFHNPAAQDFRSDIRTRISQASSATAAPWDERPWKELRVLTGQAVLESALLDFPAVKAETKFVIEWLENSNHVIGRTEVLVYPTNLLDELKRLVEESENNLGVLDPHDHLKPALKFSAVKFVDLEETELDAFSGKLAIVSQIMPDDPEWRGVTGRIARLAQKGTPVLWIQSPPPKRDKIWPSFFTVPENTNVVVMVHPELMASLPDNPQSQLNLIYFCKIALQPEPLRLPGFVARP